MLYRRVEGVAKSSGKVSSGAIIKRLTFIFPRSAGVIKRQREIRREKETKRKKSGKTNSHAKTELQRYETTEEHKHSRAKIGEETRHII